MPLAKKAKISELNWVRGAKALALFDARARRVLKISGDEFLVKWRAGEFKDMDSSDCPGVIGVALLAPTRELSSGRKNKKRGKRSV